jgi:hypothetical protein
MIGTIETNGTTGKARYSNRSSRSKRPSHIVER